MKPFHQATYLSQVRRLRRLAQGALARYGLQGAALRFITHGENTTFRVDAGARRFLLRIHRAGYHSREAILEELDWLRALSAFAAAGAAPFSVPVPVASCSGELLESMTAAGIQGPRHCALFEWVEGRFVNRSVQPKHLHALGRLIAVLHGSTRGVDVRHRRYWDAAGLVGDAPKLGPIDCIPGLDPGAQRILTEGRKAVLARLLEYERTFPERQGLIHADLHFGNFMVRPDGSLGAIDFDDCGLGFHAYDLVVPLRQIAYLCEQNRALEFHACAASLQDGYSSAGRWDDHDQAILPYLFTARGLTMVGWLLSRAENPEIGKHLLGAAERMVQHLQTRWDSLA
jgi:Ser/Thr protein kinase RdoA (MazF antagonist)